VAVASPLAGARVYDLAVRGDTAWVATDRGVVRLRTRDVSASGGVSGAALPLDGGGIALALAVVPGGAWVGSTRGLLFVADSAREAPAAERAGGAVRALVRTGSTVWAGGEQGLFRMALDGGGLSRPPAARTEPRLAGRVVALAAADSEVVAALDGDLVRIAGTDGRALPRWPALDPGMLRGVRAMAMDDRTVWVGGAAGVLVIGRRDGVARPLTIPRDVPADVYDVLLDRDYAWIATRDGVLRLRRLPDGFPR
jgi:ligand-binding sensor domain-containing protein